MHRWHHNSAKDYGQARQCMGIMTSQLQHYLARSLLWKFGHPKFWLSLSKPVGNAQPSYINLGMTIAHHSVLKNQGKADTHSGLLAIYLPFCSWLVKLEWAVSGIIGIYIETVIISSRSRHFANSLSLQTIAHMSPVPLGTASNSYSQKICLSDWVNKAHPS